MCYIRMNVIACLAGASLTRAQNRYNISDEQKKLLVTLVQHNNPTFTVQSYVTNLVNAMRKHKKQQNLMYSLSKLLNTSEKTYSYKNNIKDLYTAYIYILTSHNLLFISHFIVFACLYIA